MTDREIEQAVWAWLKAMPTSERKAKTEWLQTALWTAYRGMTKSDPHRARKQAARQRAVVNGLETARRNGCPSLSDEAYVWRERCHREMTRIAVELKATAYGLYIPTVSKGYADAFLAVWQLPDGTWIMPGSPKSVWTFEALYPTLNLPRKPIGFEFDEGCLLTDF